MTDKYSRGSHRVLLTITIDTECDKGPNWETKYPLQFEGVYRGIGEVLQPLFDKFNARPTYLLSPEVIKDEKSVKILKAQGDRAELGTHLHAEFIAPDEDMRATSWTMQNTLRPEVEEAKLTNLTNLFEETFGYRPTAFRAGRFGMSSHTLSVLERLGYVVDSSVTPLSGLNDHGGRISFFSAPQKTYHPSEDNYCRAGGLSIVEIPVTIGMSIWSRLPRFLRGPAMRSRLARSLCHRFFGPEKCRPIWLRPLASSIEQMENLSLWWIDSNGHEKVIILNMMFHNIELVQGCSPYTYEQRKVDNYVRSLNEYLAFARDRGWEFATLSEAALVFNNYS